jgi:membrane protein implicated in regulation of membrane protease activity
MFSPAFWWAIVGIGLMLFEFALPGLILFFFGLGALFTALVVWLLPLSLSLQLVVFAIASLVALFGLRRLLKPIFTGRATDVNETDLSEGMAGQEAKVTEAISPEAAGRVILNGTAWKAESNEVLSVEQAVVVTGQKSLTLIVKGK